MSKKKIVLLRNPNSTRPWQHVLEAIGGYLKLAASLKKNKKLHGEVFNFGPNHTKNYKAIFLVKSMLKYWNKVLPNFVYNIKKENLIFDTESEIKNLVHFCDLKWTEVCLNFHNNNRPIRTASDTQARSKIYNTSIDSWKHYKKYLEKYFVDLKV